MILSLLDYHEKTLRKGKLDTLSVDNIVKAVELYHKENTSEIRYLSLIHFNKEIEDIETYLIPVERNWGSYGYEEAAKELVSLVESGQGTKLESIIPFTFEDLVGWNLVNAFKHGDHTYLMTFEKDGVVKQFKHKTIEGDFIKYYDFKLNDTTYRFTDPKGHFNNEYSGGMYVVSQILKGKVISVEGTLIVTEKGKMGWTSYYHGHKSTMIECKKIAECHLTLPKHYSLSGGSVENADWLAYDKTRYQCIDVLRRETPSDSYKRNNQFGIRIHIIDDRDGSKVFSMFATEEFNYKDLRVGEQKYLNMVQPIIDKINETKEFDKLKGFVYPTVQEFLKAFEETEYEK